MNEAKGFLQSRSIWGALIAILAGVLDAVGVATLDDGTQAELVDLAIKIGAIGGGAVALWGRIVATKRIGSA